MLTIEKLFGKPPSAPLEACINGLTAFINQALSLFRALLEVDAKKIEETNTHISALERFGNLIKKGVCNHLPSSLFFPFDQKALLEILSLQSAAAGKTLKITHEAKMGKLPVLIKKKKDSPLICPENRETFSPAQNMDWRAKSMVEEIELLAHFSRKSVTG